MTSGAHGASATLACTPGAERTTPKAMQQFHLRFVYVWWAVVGSSGGLNTLHYKIKVASVECKMHVVCSSVVLVRFPPPSEGQQLRMVRTIFKPEVHGVYDTLGDVLP